jgi:hypothetical protein
MWSNNKLTAYHKTKPSGINRFYDVQCASTPNIVLHNNREKRKRHKSFTKHQNPRAKVVLFFNLSTFRKMNSVNLQFVRIYKSNKNLFQLSVCNILWVLDQT